MTFYWQPVQFHEDWCSTCIPRLARNKVGNTILDCLQPLNQIFWKAVQKCVAVVQFSGDESMNKSCCRIFGFQSLIFVISGFHYEAFALPGPSSESKIPYAWPCQYVKINPHSFRDSRTFNKLQVSHPRVPHVSVYIQEP